MTRRLAKTCSMVVALLWPLAACMAPVTEEPAFDTDGFPRAAPYAAAIQGRSVTLAFSRNRPSCIIDAPAGSRAETGWWVEVQDCDGIDYIEVQYLRPNPAGEILFQPAYTGELVVRALPPGADRARVVVGGDAGTGWFEGRP